MRKDARCDWKKIWIKSGVGEWKWVNVNRIILNSICIRQDEQGVYDAAEGAVVARVVLLLGVAVADGVWWVVDEDTSVQRNDGSRVR